MASARPKAEISSADKLSVRETRSVPKMPKKGPVTAENSSSILSSLPLKKGLDGLPKVQGYLEKWVNIIQGWKVRYFTLQSGVLFYFLSDSQNSQRRSVNLRNARISFDEKENTRFLVEDSRVILHLRAPSQDMRDIWVLALKESKDIISALSKALPFQQPYQHLKERQEGVPGASPTSLQKDHQSSGSEDNKAQPPPPQQETEKTKEKRETVEVKKRKSIEQIYNQLKILHDKLHNHIQAFQTLSSFSSSPASSQALPPSSSSNSFSSPELPSLSDASSSGSLSSSSPSVSLCGQLFEEVKNFDQLSNDILLTIAENFQTLTKCSPRPNNNSYSDRRTYCEQQLIKKLKVENFQMRKQLGIAEEQTLVDEGILPFLEDSQTEEIYSDYDLHSSYNANNSVSLDQDYTDYSSELETDTLSLDSAQQIRHKQNPKISNYPKNPQNNNQKTRSGASAHNNFNNKGWANNNGKKELQGGSTHFEKSHSDSNFLSSSPSTSSSMVGGGEINYLQLHPSTRTPSASSLSSDSATSSTNPTRRPSSAAIIPVPVPSSTVNPSNTKLNNHDNNKNNNDHPSSRSNNKTIPTLVNQNPSSQKARLYDSDEEENLSDSDSDDAEFYDVMEDSSSDSHSEEHTDYNNGNSRYNNDLMKSSHQNGILPGGGPRTIVGQLTANQLINSSNINSLLNNIEKIQTKKVSLEETLATVDKVRFANRRRELPADKSKRGFSLWALLKDAVGKDVTKITLPVILCEPLTFLQRVAENFEYSELLDVAAATNDSCLRLLYVSSFGISGYSSSFNRWQKPFNSVLGETYELVHPEKKFRMFCEQVSHHPPIGGVHVESPTWTFWSDVWMKSKFWGRSLEFYPNGKLNLRFNKLNEYITWDKVTSCVHNILMGTLWIEHYGTMTVMNHTTGDRCIIEFLKKGWWGEGEYVVQGVVTDANGVQRYRLDGKWNESISGTNLTSDDQKPFEIWRKAPMPRRAKEQYDMTLFSIQLNELPDYLRPWLPPTDARLRTDQHFLEIGDVDRAGEEKTRIEIKQRKARKDLEMSKKEYHPRWFVRNEDDTAWVYGGDYWEQRHQQRFMNCPDLF